MKQIKTTSSQQYLTRANQYAYDNLNAEMSLAWSKNAYSMEIIFMDSQTESLSVKEVYDSDLIKALEALKILQIDTG